MIQSIIISNRRFIQVEMKVWCENCDRNNHVLSHKVGTVIKKDPGLFLGHSDDFGTFQDPQEQMKAF